MRIITSAVAGLQARCRLRLHIHDRLRLPIWLLITPAEGYSSSNLYNFQYLLNKGITGLILTYLVAFKSRAGLFGCVGLRQIAEHR